MEISQTSPTSNGHNFFVYEAILIIFGYLVKYMLALSNYAVFAEFRENRARAIARSKSQFCENRIHSPTYIWVCILKNMLTQPMTVTESQMMHHIENFRIPRSDFVWDVPGLLRCWVVQSSRFGNFSQLFFVVFLGASWWKMSWIKLSRYDKLNVFRWYQAAIRLPKTKLWTRTSPGPAYDLSTFILLKNTTFSIWCIICTYSQVLLLS